MFGSIKKAFKKVFKPIKKVMKKIAKPALMIGATLFTSGIVSGGFGAFSSVGAAGSLGSKIGAFMGAVGKTIGQGATALTGGLFGGGAQSGGATISDLASQEGMGALQSSLNALPGAGGTVTQGGGGGGFLGNVMGALKNFGSTDTGKMIIAQGIMGGIQSYAEGRERRRQEKRYDKQAVFGVRRRGSKGENPYQAPDLDLGTSQSGSVPSPNPYMPEVPNYNAPPATPAPTQNPSPAWTGPAPYLPPQQYEYNYNYQNYGQQGPGLIGGMITPIGPNYG